MISKTGKYRKYFFYLIIFSIIITLVYFLSLSSFRKVEDLVSNRQEISRIYEKWLIVKSDTLSYLKSDKQDNIKAKLNQSLEFFERDFLFFSKTDFDRLKGESPEILENSILLLDSWQNIQKNIREILETPDDFENFSKQIYWLSNNTVVFEEYLKELLRWFDSYNSRQLLFHWRTFYFFAVLIIISSLLAARFTRKYIHEKTAREKTLNLMHSIVSERETERLKLAIDIHDTIIQDLSFSKMLCYDLHDSRLKYENKKKLDDLTAIIMNTTRQIREITYDLMPPEIDNVDIESVLSEYCNNFQDKTGIKIDLSVAGFKDIKMKNSQRLTLYRILQECLTNVRKHSCAENVQVKLLLTYPYVLFKVSDDGKGAENCEESKPSGHHLHIGLKGIKERVSMFDGEVNIKTIPGEGFTIGVKMLLMESENERL
ncbi:MAG: histidine kinase [Spirochaetia bacterium]|nr:histidine kinase [Spirochaetia bacterium]